jgi:Metallo-beta-lactamase superfamily
MSLDNTSHPGRQGSDEVPSRYPLRVGEIDVLVISDGVLPLPTAMLAHNVDPAVRAAWLKDRFLPPEMLLWPLNVVVVRSGGQTVLIDSGLGADPDLNLPRAGRLVRRLEAAGVDLASVTDVVMTHMHMDHVGGLLVDGVRERLRPDLRVHLAAAEVDSGRRPTSPASPCRRDSRTRFGGRPSGSWTRTTAGCGRSRRSTRWRRGCSSVAPAATPPGTPWSAWRPATTG